MGLSASSWLPQVSVPINHFRERTQGAALGTETCFIRQSKFNSKMILGTTREITALKAAHMILKCQTIRSSYNNDRPNSFSSRTERFARLRAIEKRKQNGIQHDHELWSLRLTKLQSFLELMLWNTISWKLQLQRCQANMILWQNHKTNWVSKAIRFLNSAH